MSSMYGVTLRYGSSGRGDKGSMARLIALLVGVSVLLGLPVGYDRYIEHRIEAQVNTHTENDRRAREEMREDSNRRFDELKQDMNREFDSLNEHLLYIRGRIDGNVKANR